MPNQETLFLLIKTYLESDSSVDVVGVYKEHYLVDKTEFFVKVKKGNAKDVFLKALLMMIMKYASNIVLQTTIICSRS